MAQVFVFQAFGGGVAVVDGEKKFSFVLEMNCRGRDS